MIERPRQNSTQPIKTISLKELLVEQSKNPNLILIDVRELDEWNEGHLENAKHIPLSSLEFIAWRGDFPKDATIVFYCRSAKRSTVACGLFLGKGYTDVRNLIGGIAG